MKTEQKNINFYLVLIRTKKKIDKYFKINKIRNKQIIDIKKIMEEEKVKLNDKDSVAFFKLLVWNKIKTAREKGKDVYYIPNFSTSELDIKKLFKLKDNLLEKGDNFNLLLFYQEFIATIWLIDTLDNIEIFNNTQILEEY
jgi:hypothetical protein